MSIQRNMLNDNQEKAKYYCEQGEKYFFGIGVSPDYSLSYSYYKKAADLDDTYAMDRLRDFHYFGFGNFDVNQEEARRWASIRIDTLNRKAIAGDLHAKYNLAKVYELGDIDCSITKDEGKAIEIYTELAQHEFSEAFLSLGKIAYYKKDEDNSMRWLLKYAGYEPAKAYREIGFQFRNTQISTEYYSKYFSLVERLAKNGNPSYMQKLGHCYKFGQGVDIDFRKAAEWYRKAAESADDPAFKKDCYFAFKGDCYCDIAELCKKDLKSHSNTREKAELHWLLLAYNNYSGLAGIRLENIFWNGDCNGVDLGKYVTLSPALGSYILRKNAQEGHFISRIRLAKCYFYGKGTIEKDLVMSQMWFEKVLAQFGQTTGLVKEREEIYAYLKKIKAALETEKPKNEKAFDFFVDCNNWSAIQNRYRNLMKSYHPDTGNGSEETAKIINSQFDALKAKYNIN